MHDLKNVHPALSWALSNRGFKQLTEVQKNKMLENIPMKKFGEPNDVANLVYFLSSDKASYITGQNFHVNGGMLTP